ncbi:MAG TPA: protein DA1 [Ktedonobacteraceae bacterium]|nr:protein DA1 [Ktedonobacteraceae bacterium]
MPSCKYCGQVLWGNYINALGADWHPEHFLCAGCGHPLRDESFRIVDGQPYHDACYLTYQAPRCSYCSQPISGPYQRYEGRSYHNECYREHVGPRCAYCQRPISGVYQKYEGHSYHSACYREHVAPRCIYCHKPLLSEYLLDGWGGTYCLEHQDQYPHCSFCGRLVPPVQQTPGWDAYGVTRCAICRASSIEAVEQAQPLFQECKQWIARQGFRFNQLPLRLELHDRPTLLRMLQGRSINHPLGVTLSSRQMRNGHLYTSQIEGVAMLQGMPPTLFAGVVLHELGHVWLTVHHIEHLPPWAEEGFCQLLSYRYYSTLNTPEARYHAERLEHSNDPIYGEGFRKMRALADKMGFQRFIENLQTGKRLPGI